MTIAGMQVQMNLQVPTCCPGIVRVCGEQLPPKAAAWAEVHIKPGQVSVDRKLAALESPGLEKPQSFENVDKADILELLAPDPPRFTHTLAGIALAGARPMVSANTSYNKGKALCGRVFRQQPRAEWGRGPCPEIWRWARQFVPELLGEFTTERMSVEEWLDSMPSRRRKALRAAYLKYQRAGWTEGYVKFAAFVKTELLPGFGKRGGDLDRLLEMMDRIIQGPRDETHVIAGPWLKPLLKKLKTLWRPDGPIFYGSAGPEDLHVWLQRLVEASTKDAQPGLLFWSDFTMFDNTHSQESWAFLEWLYSQAGIDDVDFWKVIDAWRQPSGRIGPFRYKANIMNASGRDDTALANAILNGFATYLSAVAAYLRKPLCTLTIRDVHEARASDVFVSVCGDDSLGRVPILDPQAVEQFRQSMVRNLRMFGFTAKLYCSMNIGDAVYLGMRPYPTKSGWFWGKTIGRATYKMGWVLDKGDRDVMAHITGIADMHSLCSRHVPVLADLAAKIVELRAGAKRTPPALDENRPWEWTYQSGVEYDEITLKAVAEAYSTRVTASGPHDVDQDVTVKDILDLVDTIRGIRQLPCVVDHWLWRRMVLVDDL